jgi:hypothetical protein
LKGKTTLSFIKLKHLVFYPRATSKTIITINPQTHRGDIRIIILLRLWNYFYHHKDHGAAAKAKA